MRYAGEPEEHEGELVGYAGEPGDYERELVGYAGEQGTAIKLVLHSKPHHR